MTNPLDLQDMPEEETPSIGGSTDGDCLSGISIAITGAGV
jgi:hypothetical protein